MRKPAAREHATAARDPDVTEEIALDGAQHLFGAVEYRKFLRSDTEERIAWLGHRFAAAHKLSREQHLARIVEAYALYAQVRNEPSVRHAVLEAAAAQGRKPDARTSSLRLVLELTINYGGEDGEEEKRRAGRLYSRDVAAITALIQRGVAPSQVIALSAQIGEGLNRWAKLRPDTTPVGGSASTGEVAAPCSEPAADDIEPGSPPQKNDVRDLATRLTKAPPRFSRSPATARTVKITVPASKNVLIWETELPNGQTMRRARMEVEGLGDDSIEEFFKDVWKSCCSDG